MQSSGELVSPTAPWGCEECPGWVRSDGAGPKTSPGPVPGGGCSPAFGSCPSCLPLPAAAACGDRGVTEPGGAPCGCTWHRVLHSGDAGGPRHEQVWAGSSEEGHGDATEPGRDQEPAPLPAPGLRPPRGAGSSMCQPRRHRGACSTCVCARQGRALPLQAKGYVRLFPRAMGSGG